MWPALAMRHQRTRGHPCSVAQPIAVHLLVLKSRQAGHALEIISPPTTNHSAPCASEGAVLIESCWAYSVLRTECSAPQGQPLAPAHTCSHIVQRISGTGCYRRRPDGVSVGVARIGVVACLTMAGAITVKLPTWSTTSSTCVPILLLSQLGQHLDAQIRFITRVPAPSSLTGAAPTDRSSGKA